MRGTRLRGNRISQLSRDHGNIPNPVQNRRTNPEELPDDGFENFHACTTPMPVIDHCCNPPIQIYMLGIRQRFFRLLLFRLICVFRIRKGGEVVSSQNGKWRLFIVSSSSLRLLVSSRMCCARVLSLEPAGGPAAPLAVGAIPGQQPVYYMAGVLAQQAK